MIKKGDYILKSIPSENISIAGKFIYNFIEYSLIDILDTQIIFRNNKHENSIDYPFLKPIITTVIAVDNEDISLKLFNNVNTEYISVSNIVSDQDHVVDPTYFYDAIEMFSFNYDLYRVSDYQIDDYGKRTSLFTKESIRGSLQSGGKNLNQNKEGNTNSMNYNFYCKSLYRINIGDFINYKDRWLHVNSVSDYDEYGCRSCRLTLVQLTDYKDLEEYVKYIKGEIIV